MPLPPSWVGHTTHFFISDSKMCEKKVERNEAHTGRIVLYAMALSAVMALCYFGALAGDFRNDRFYHLATKFGVMVFISLFIAWKIRNVEVFHKAKFLKHFILCAFVGVFLLAPITAHFPALVQNTKDIALSTMEKESTCWRKTVHLGKQFPSAFETFFTKKFPLPHWLIQFNALIKVYVFGLSPNSKITLGKNGFYFNGIGAERVEAEIVDNFDNISDYMGQIPFSENELLQWKMTLEQRNYWLKKQGSEFVFVLAPTKAFVYPEFLPKSIGKRKGKTRYEQLSEYLRNYADIHFIDLLPPLLEAKAQTPYPLLFYKTDFHWNFYGAFIAYKTIVDRMAAFFPQHPFDSTELSDFKMEIYKHWAHQRFMYTLGLPISLHKNEHHITMIPKPGGPYASSKDIPRKGIYDVHLPVRKIVAPDGKSIDISMVINPKAPIPSIALFGDSFLQKLVFYFSANARRVLNYRTIVNFPDHIFHYETPTVVIQEILNMFILRPPPENPEKLKKDYFKKKYERSSKNVLYWENTKERPRTEGEGFPKKAKNQFIPLQGLPELRTGEIRTAEIKIDASDQGTVAFKLIPKDASEPATRLCDISTGTSTCHIDVSTRALHSIECSSPDGSACRAEVKSIEIRSDMH